MGGRAWESRGESGREILQLLEVGTERLPVLTTSNTGNQTPLGPDPHLGVVSQAPPSSAPAPALPHCHLQPGSEHTAPRH